MRGAEMIEFDVLLDAPLGQVRVETLEQNAFITLWACFGVDPEER